MNVFPGGERKKLRKDIRKKIIRYKNVTSELIIFRVSADLHAVGAHAVKPIICNKTLVTVADMNRRPNARIEFARSSAEKLTAFDV